MKTLRYLVSHRKGIVRTELERLDEQLRCAFEGGSWHGPSVREALDGVTAEDAWRHPIAGAHSIWELVLHLSGTYSLILRRLDQLRSVQRGAR